MSVGVPDNRLSKKAEVLFRQIHPECIEENGQLTSQPFCPTTKDGDKLSVDRSALTSARASYELYRKNGHQSGAVYGLTVGEFDGEEIPCVGDPLDGNPAHALADYSSTPNKSQRRRKAKRLRELAVKRGSLYSPPPPPPTSDSTEA